MLKTGHWTDNMNKTILSIDNLSVSFFSPQGEIEAVRNISLNLHKNEILAIVGESGSGKSVLCKTVMGLLPRQAQIKNGKIIVNDTDITHSTEKQKRQMRGKLFSIIFQDPLLSLNPVYSVGEQITETILVHQKISFTQAKEKAINLMKDVGIDFPHERFFLKPHCFSGGMLQRCVIASAIAQQPQILFADEPTTALDAITKIQILNLLKELQKKLNISIIFISHDLGTVARIADRIAVMYAGKIIETGTVKDIFYHPAHPYTRELLLSQPIYAQKGKKLHTIPGEPPLLINPPQGDIFSLRNKYALKIDYVQMPPFFKLSDTHSVASWLYDKRAPKNILPAWKNTQ